jgi:hypothetical protein
MQTTSSTDTERSLAVELILEDIPGGGVVEKDDFPTADTEMKEGALLAKANDGIYHLTKTVEVHTNAASGATTVEVEKKHALKVGNILTNTGKTATSRAITAIDTTSSIVYDTLTLAAALGVAIVDGDILIEASATGVTGASFKYSPEAIATNPVDLDADNTGCGLMVRGRVRESLLPYPVDSTIKALLPLIRFV